MFGLFGSKGVTHLRSVYTDYELINQIYHKLKDLNESEIRTRISIRNNNLSGILSELHRQHGILASIDDMAKIKFLRMGDLNKLQTENIKKRISQLEGDINTYTREHKRHLSTIKDKEDKHHIEYIKKHYEEKIRRIHADIHNYRKLLEETNNLRQRMRKECKKDLEDTQRLIYNV